MRSSIRGVILGTVGLALAGLAGCENNEAGVKGTGVTPPSAVTSSDDAGKIKTVPPAAPSGYGPAMGKKNIPRAKPEAEGSKSDTSAGKK